MKLAAACAVVACCLLAGCSGPATAPTSTQAPTTTPASACHPEGAAAERDVTLRAGDAQGPLGTAAGRIGEFGNVSASPGANLTVTATWAKANPELDHLTLKVSWREGSGGDEATLDASPGVPLHLRHAGPAAHGLELEVLPGAPGQASAVVVDEPVHLAVAVTSPCA